MELQQLQVEHDTLLERHNKILQETISKEAELRERHVGFTAINTEISKSTCLRGVFLFFFVFFFADHLSIVCQNLQAAVGPDRERDPALRSVPGPDRPVLPDRDPAPDLQGAAEEAAGRPPGHRRDPAGAADPRRGTALQPAESEQ